MPSNSGTDTPRGLYEKYEVYKDGERVEDCFVLEPANDRAAWRALEVYASVTENEELAADLDDLLARTEDEHDG